MHCTCEETEITQAQIDSAVDQVLSASLADAQQRGGVCPLCGHAKHPPFWNRRSVLFLLALASTLLLVTLLVLHLRQRATSRSQAAAAALSQVQNNATARALLGTPIRITSGISGSVTQDETGWQEAHLHFVIAGSRGEAEVTAIANQDGSRRWNLSTLTVVAPQLHKKADLISSVISSYDPAAYIDLHTEAARSSSLIRSAPPPPTLGGSHPCVFEDLTSIAPQPTLDDCATPTGHAGVADRFEVDLRYGAFVLRQTDLRVNDVFDVPLTRSYRSDDWLSQSRSHAFGNNSNHPYDIAPLGTRNPYTEQHIVLEDGDFFYFERISQGTGYADAIFQHTETSTRFYKATQSWNGHGWTLRFADGSTIDFPESYSAKNLAQGAAISEHNSQGDELKLLRDPRRNLLEILTPHGRSLRFQYDEQDRITQASDDQGNWSTYTYTPQGMLEDVRHSSGQNDRHYTYSGVLLTSVQDSLGHNLVRNSYRYGFLVRQDFGDDRVFTYTYYPSVNHLYAQKVIVTFPNGAQREVDTASSVSPSLRNLPAGMPEPPVRQSYYAGALGPVMRGVAAAIMISLILHRRAKRKRLPLSEPIPTL